MNEEGRFPHQIVIDKPIPNQSDPPPQRLIQNERNLCDKNYDFFDGSVSENVDQNFGSQSVHY